MDLTVAFSSKGKDYLGKITCSALKILFLNSSVNFSIWQVGRCNFKNAQGLTSLHEKNNQDVKGGQREFWNTVMIIYPGNNINYC